METMAEEAPVVGQPVASAAAGAQGANDVAAPGNASQNEAQQVGCLLKIIKTGM